MGSSERAPRGESSSSYLRLLLLLLGASTFFQGYDAGIPAIILPELASSFHVGTASLGVAVAVVNLGALLALFVTRQGDRYGRRPLLIGTTLLYALFSGLTATASNVYLFGTFQFAARIFLVAELATALTLATEEFPAARRGRMIGTLSAMTALGVIAAAMSYRVLAHTSLGWRALYLFGTMPLIGTALARTHLRESARWLEGRRNGASVEAITFRRVVAGPYRYRLATVCGVLATANFAVLGASAYWSYFAREERGFSVASANTYLAGAVLAGLPGYIVAGRLQDRVGRRPTGAVFLMLALFSGVVAFESHDHLTMFISLAGAVFFGFGATPVTSALASELFPTEIRATAVAICGPAAGTIGASIGFLVIGVLADRHGLVGNVGDSVSLAVLALVPAAGLLLALPETAGRELEDLRIGAVA